MKRNISVWLGILILALFLGSFVVPAKAAEDKYDVTINNKNSFTITLTFVGLNIQQFNLAPGKTTIQLERATYQHSYYGCGQLNFGTYTVKPKDNSLVIEACSTPVTETQPAGTELLNLRNHTPTTFPITFRGIDSNKDYEFTLVPGNNRLYMEPGKYAYSYYACSALHYGTVKVTVKPAEMNILSCSSSDNGAAVTNTLSSFKLKNNTGDTVILVLKGNLDYLFAIAGSGSTMTVEIGFYSYTLYACGTTYDGVIQVTGQGGYILKTPYCSPDNAAQ